MSDEFAKLSVSEIKALIERAQIEIAVRQHAGKEKVKAEIAEKLASAGLDFADLFPELGGKKTGKRTKAASASEVPAKYKDHVSGDTWSGRGPRPPRWVKSIMSQRGWTIEEFKASEEYLAQN
jgi:DNA-binding protein H-NS